MTRRSRQSKPIGPRQPRQEPRSAKGDQPGSSPVTHSATTAAKPFGPKDWLFAFALLVAVFLVYQPAWQGGLIWDDVAHVTRPELQSWQGLYRIWFNLGATQQYYPLLHSAFWVEHKLWGDATLGYHLVSILLHAVAALMVALILRRLAIPGAYLAAAIFALHPVHVESVAWITELKNTLSAVFYLGAMLVYLRFDQQRKTWAYAGALGLFVLGLLSKTVTATLPAALLVIFWWQRERLSWKRDVLPLMPHFVLGAAAGVFTAWVENTLVGANGAEFNLTVIDRCLIAGRAIWFYLGKLFWPADLLFIYPRWHVSQAIWWQYLFPLVALAALAALWGLRRRWRAPLAGLLFFVGTLFPVLGFFNVFPFIYSFVADHFQYLASVGIISLVSAGAALLLDRWRLWGRPAGYALCLALLAILAGLTWRQSRMYTNIDMLYQTTIDGNPTCWMAHTNLGTVLARRGQFDEAIAHWQRSLEINSNDTQAHNNLGLVLARRGRLDEAITHYQQALNTEPNDPKFHRNLGTALISRGQPAQAVIHFRKALEGMPDDARLHDFLGLALAASGHIDEAMVHYRKALEINPDDATAHGNLALALAASGKPGEGITHYRRALEINPDSVQIQNNLAWLLATYPDASIRNGSEAIELAQRAFQHSEGRQPEILNTLAAAYAEMGRFPEAAETARRAFDRALAQDKTTLADAIQARIKLYRAGSRYYEKPRLPSPSGRP
jgi:protein O-mannosyl-transferase